MTKKREAETFLQRNALADARAYGGQFAAMVCSQPFQYLQNERKRVKIDCYKQGIQ